MRKIWPLWGFHGSPPHPGPLPVGEREKGLRGRWGGVLPRPIFPGPVLPRSVRGDAYARILVSSCLVLLVIGCVAASPSSSPAPSWIPIATAVQTLERRGLNATLTSGTTAAGAPADTGSPQPDSEPTESATPGAPNTAIPCQKPASQLTVDYVNSPVLARRVAYSLYLPPCYGIDPNRRYPVLYLLHGANTDHTQWPDLQVQPDADVLIAAGSIAPLIVVMPGGDYRQGEDYGAFVLRDLIPQIERTLSVAADGKDRAIGGLSQGGYWALDLALAHPQLFAAVGGHSPATDSALTDLLSTDRIPDLKGLRIYLDVGDNDPLAGGVATFAAALRARGLTPVFHIYPGAHNRPYWRSHTTEYLMFYAARW